jgi:soluble lytic murein transglycosylase
MRNEKKSWSYEGWMASGVAATVALIGLVWYTVSTLTGHASSRRAPITMLSSAEAAASANLLDATGAPLAPTPAPVLNKVLLVPYPDDPLIVEAHQAYLAKDLNALKVYMGRVTEHPLKDYLSYWYWKRALEVTPLSNEFNDSIQAWLRAHTGSLLAERLRQDWLKKQLPSITPRFLPEYELLTKPDDELMCASWLLKGRSEMAKTEESRLWVSYKELSPACEQWLGMWAKQGESTRFRYRLYLSSLHGSARALGRMASFSTMAPPADLVELYAHPVAWLTKQSKLDSMWSVVAILRLANSAQGAHQARAWLDRVDPSYRNEASAFVGYALAKHLQPEAVTYFRNGLLSAELPPEVLSWRLRAMLRQSAWQDVLQTTQMIADPLKEEDTAWRYWQARALVELKREADAKVIFQSLAGEPHYYGILAKEALGEGWGPLVGSTVYPSQKDVMAMANDPSVQRALILSRMDWKDEARREWQWALRNATDEQLNAAAYVAWQYQRYDWAMNTAARTQINHNLGLRFLSPYQGVAEQAGQQFEVPAAWILGVIRQESRFDPHAYSSAGAAGLMQLMPSTARDIAKKTGLQGTDLTALMDPDINIPMGAYYLHELTVRLGAPVKVIAAYNAGATRARQWQALEPLDGAVYVESIPFDETRNYVKRVLSNWYFYHRVLGNKNNLTLTRLLGTIAAVGGKETPWAEDDQVSTVAP